MAGQQTLSKRLAALAYKLSFRLKALAWGTSNALISNKQMRSSDDSPGRWNAENVLLVEGEHVSELADDGCLLEALRRGTGERDLARAPAEQI